MQKRPFSFASPVERDQVLLNTPAARLEHELKRIPDFVVFDPPKGKKRVLLIGCGKRKLPSPSAAQDLYRSPRSRSLVCLASLMKSDFRIISAKWGVLQPNVLVSPYEYSLDHLSSEELTEWVDNLSVQFAAEFDPRMTHFLILASGVYLTSIVSAVRRFGATYDSPLRGLTTGLQLSWLKKAQQTVRRSDDLRSLYGQLELAKGSGSLTSLGKLLSNGQVPEKGVYLFLDNTERSKICPSMPRLVRIGTHAVSEGSKATLRNRLRTHLGTQRGTGNHRSSVFRLHVGNALTESEPQADWPRSWGEGKSYSLEVIAGEEPLERRVTEYLRELLVAVIPVDDPSSKESKRRLLERNLIALLTEDGILIDPPSKNWLGNYSTNSIIRTCGIWNVNDVFSHYEPQYRSLVRVVENA